MNGEENKTTTTNIPGCFGCFLEIAGLLGLLYVINHWSAIWSFIIN